MKLTVRNSEFDLLPERALWREDNRTLILADLHLGKVNHFRRNGIAVPRMAERNNLWRLSGLIKDYKPDRLIFLGDLFHSKMNLAWEEFVDFRKMFQHTKMVLVKGNHDILRDDDFYAANLELTDLLEEDGMVFSHDRIETEAFNIYGHIHPCVRLRGRAKQSLRLPCFFFSDQYGILPSFGDFTGGYVISPRKTDRVFVPLEKEVIEID